MDMELYEKECQFTEDQLQEFRCKAGEEADVTLNGSEYEEDEKRIYRELVMAAKPASKAALKVALAEEWRAQEALEQIRRNCAAAI